MRRLIGNPSEFREEYGRGDEVFSGYLHQDLLGRCSQEVLEAFPGLEGEMKATTEGRPPLAGPTRVP